MKAGDIILYHGHGDFGSRVIRWWTHSKFSHCGIIVAVNDDGSCVSIEAQPQGVVRVENPKYDVLAPTSDFISDKGMADGMDWLLGQVGDPYGFADILDQPIKRFFHWAPLLVQPRGFDCSDLCAHFLLIAGFEARAGQRARLAETETISPGQLARILDIQ